MIRFREVHVKAPNGRASFDGRDTNSGINSPGGAPSCNSRRIGRKKTDESAPRLSFSRNSRAVSSSSITIPEYIPRSPLNGEYQMSSTGAAQSQEVRLGWAMLSIPLLRTPVEDNRSYQ